MVARVSLDVIKRRIHPHVLRHTFATQLAKVTNIRVVQELLGHSSLESTQIYTHPDMNEAREAVNRLIFPK